MQPQDYTVRMFTPWQDKQSGQEVRDPHGNIKGSLHLNGLADPVDGTFKNPPAEGATIYGHIESYQTRSGATRQKFKRDQKQDFGGGSPTNAVGSSGSRQFKADPEKQASIEAQFSIKTAIEYLHANPTLTDFGLSDVESVASDLFNMIDRIKQGSTTPSEPQKSNVAQSQPTEEVVAQKQATRDWNSLHKGNGGQGGESFVPEDIDLNDLFPGE